MTKPKTLTQIRSIARAYSVTAINTLVGIMSHPKATPQARIMAACKLLDIGWGKPTRPISGDKEDPLTITHIVRTIVDPAVNASGGADT